MTKKRSKPTWDFTLVELMMTTVIVVIVGLAIGVVVVDAQSSWNVMYDRTNSDAGTSFEIENWCEQ